MEESQHSEKKPFVRELQLFEQMEQGVYVAAHLPNHSVSGLVLCAGYARPGVSEGSVILLGIDFNGKLNNVHYITQNRLKVRNGILVDREDPIVANKSEEVDAGVYKMAKNSLERFLRGSD